MSIPSQSLLCHICSGNPTFSDVSHLLTHLSSKAHLSAEFKAKTSAASKPEMAEAVRQFNAWSKRWGVGKLLEQRLAAKELKKANEASERVRKPYEEKPPGGKSATKNDNEPLARSGNTGLARTSLPATRPESSDSSEDELNHKKLKGTKFPGMGIFDAADEYQKKRRNQRKDASVVKKMQEDSLDIHPVQRIYSNDMRTVVEAKSCYATPTPHNSEDEEDEKTKPKAGKSSKGSKAPTATVTATQHPTGTRPLGPNPGLVMRPLTTQRRPNHWDREEQEERARRERRRTMGHNFPPRSAQFQPPQDDIFTAPPERMTSNFFAQSLRPRPAHPPPNPHALQGMNPNTNYYTPPEAPKPPSQSSRYFAGRARPGMSFPSRHTDGGQFLPQIPPGNTGTMLDPYTTQLRQQHEQQNTGFMGQNYGFSGYGREPQQPGYDYHPPGNNPAPPAPMGNPAMGVAPMAPMAPMDPFTQAQIGHGNAPVHPQYNPGRQFEEEDDEDFERFNCDLPYGGARGGGFES